MWVNHVEARVCARKGDRSLLNAADLHAVAVQQRVAHKEPASDGRQFVRVSQNGLGLLYLRQLIRRHAQIRSHRNAGDVSHVRGRARVHAMRLYAYGIADDKTHRTVQPRTLIPTRRHRQDRRLDLDIVLARSRGERHFEDCVAVLPRRKQTSVDEYARMIHHSVEDKRGVARAFWHNKPPRVDARADDRQSACASFARVRLGLAVVPHLHELRIVRPVERPRDRPVMRNAHRLGPPVLRERPSIKEIHLVRSSRRDRRGKHNAQRKCTASHKCEPILSVCHVAHPLYPARKMNGRSGGI